MNLLKNKITQFVALGVANLSIAGSALAASGIDIKEPDTGLGNRDLVDTIGQIIQIILGFLGVLAVIIILIGGFKWMLSAGNEEKVEEGKKAIIAGVIGLVIVLASWAITEFVIDNIIDATTE